MLALNAVGLFVNGTTPAKRKAVVMPTSLQIGYALALAVHTDYAKAWAVIQGAVGQDRQSIPARYVRWAIWKHIDSALKAASTPGTPLPNPDNLIQVWHKINGVAT